MAEFDPSTLQDLLPSYYNRLFPFSEMYRWLSYGSAEYFSRREFSFTLAGDVYLRYQSFSGDEEFKKELMRRNPEKIDIGAVFTQKPKTRESAIVFQPLEKEFVLDIDLTDYDDVRTCCSGAKVCEKCWKFLIVAVKILDRALKEDFGFEHVLWVYSGRRGVHCWISDECARQMDSNAREAVIEYLSVTKGGEGQSKKVKIEYPENIHSHLAKSIDVIDDYLEEMWEEQNFLQRNNPVGLPGDATRGYSEFQNYVAINKKEKKSLCSLEKELPLLLCYPRLDVNVSKGLNHLLKSPFCIHPKTGQVCVPFDPKSVDEFSPAGVPRLSQLLQEIADYDKKESASAEAQTPGSGSSQVKPDWTKTGLAPYVTVLRNFVKKLESSKDKENLSPETTNKDLSW